MAIRIQAVTDRKVGSNVALRAYKVDDGAVGGNPVPVYKIDDSDLVENGGNFKVSGNNPNQFLVYEVENETPLGGSAIPIYIINDTPPGPTLDPEYLAVEAFYSEIPTTVWREAASQFFIDVRDALGIATLGDGFDFMYLLAHESANDALINIVSPGTYDATNVNAMTFEVSRGYTGNGSNSYLNTNAILDLLLWYDRTNACFGTYSRTDSNLSVVDMGARDNATLRRTIQQIRVGGSFTQRVNNDSASVVSVANPDSLGLYCSNRSAHTAEQTYKNGVNIGVTNGASIFKSNFEFFIGALNTGGVASLFSTRQYAFAFAGRSMDATEQSNFYAAVQTFMVAVGANVSGTLPALPLVEFEPLTAINDLGAVLLAQQGINPTVNFGAYAGL